MLDFEAKVRLNEKKLFLTAMSILKSRQDAEDAVSSSLMLAWKSLKALKDESCFDGWLMKITVNEAYKLARKRKPEADFDALE